MPCWFKLSDDFVLCGSQFGPLSSRPFAICGVPVHVVLLFSAQCTMRCMRFGVGGNEQSEQIATTLDVGGMVPSYENSGLPHAVGQDSTCSHLSAPLRCGSCGRQLLGIAPHLLTSERPYPASGVQSGCSTRVQPKRCFRHHSQRTGARSDVSSLTRLGFGKRWWSFTLARKRPFRVKQHLWPHALLLHQKFNTLLDTSNLTSGTLHICIFACTLWQVS